MAVPASTRSGIVLAAGFGSRLVGTSDATELKPLTPVAGVPLIERTLDSLEHAGCSRAIIVLGYQPETVRRAIGEAYKGSLDLHFAVNEQYALKNGVSVLAARPYLLGHDFLLTMADHVVGDEVMEQARMHYPAPGTATLLVDYKLDAIFDMDDATKVRERNGRVESIGKQIHDFNCVDTGVFIGTHGLMDALHHVYTERGDASLSEGVQHLAHQRRMFTLDIGSGFWQDVDTPAMLEHAEEILQAREHFGIVSAA